jgi:hypothetical protein
MGKNSDSVPPRLCEIYSFADAHKTKHAQDLVTAFLQNHQSQFPAEERNMVYLGPPGTLRDHPELLSALLYDALADMRTPKLVYSAPVGPKPE